jgi:hypothetical protein
MAIQSGDRVVVQAPAVLPMRPAEPVKTMRRLQRAVQRRAHG